MTGWSNSSSYFTASSRLSQNWASEAPAMTSIEEENATNDFFSLGLPMPAQEDDQEDDPDIVSGIERR